MPVQFGGTYESCCGRYHRGFKAPDAGPWPGTAEALMRSRFSAFAMHLPDYLLASWHPQTRPVELALDDAVVWRNLEIIRTVAGGPFDMTGIVEFEARYRLLGHSETQHEVSRFQRTDGRWYYLDSTD